MNEVPNNENIDLLLEIYDKEGCVADRMVLRNVCFSNDGTVDENSEIVVMGNVKAHKLPDIKNGIIKALSVSGGVSFDFDELSHLTSLENLYLSCYGMTGDIAALSELTGLRVLRISSFDSAGVTGRFVKSF